MLLSLSVYDGANHFRGHAKLRLDRSQQKWSIVEDRDLVWQRVGFSRSGHFDIRSVDVYWLWDLRRNTLVLWDVPTGDSDRRHALVPGEGLISDPKDGNFRNGRVRWVVDTGGTPQVSALRKRALQVLEKITPAPYGSENWKRNPFHSTKPGRYPGYTTCVEFPAYYGYLLGDERFPRGYPPVTTKGWKDAGTGKRPLPGDVFILCKGQQRDGTTAHVGVIYSTNWKGGGNIWRTADWGQGGGWDGAWVERVYDPDAETLTGDRASPFPAPRAIKGWVDIEVYFGLQGS